MNPETPTFDAVESELTSLIDVASGRWHVRSTQKAFERGDFERACDRLEGLAEGVRQLDLSRRAWREIVVALLDAIVAGREDDRLPDVMTNYVWRAWDPLDTDDLPWEIARPLTTANRTGAFYVGTRIGELFSRHYVRLPLGPYAEGHFLEMQGLDHGARHGDVDAPGRFERAAELYEGAGKLEEANHCRLRAAVGFFRAGLRVQRGRDLMKAARKQDIADEDRLWYALGMAHSPFWLDRVRSADVLDELAEGVTANRPEFRHLDLAEIESTARILFRRAPTSLTPMEEDRMTALLDSVLPEDERETWAGRIAVGAELHEKGETALAEVEDLSDVLDMQAAGDVELVCTRAVISAFHGATPLIPADAGEAPVGTKVVEYLTAEEPTSETIDAVTRALPSAPPSGWRPVAVLLARATADDALDDDVRESLEGLVAAWAPRAPEPGYGWWPLSTRLHAVKCRVGGALVARRALEEGARAEDDVMNFALARSLDWAVREADETALLWWLEAVRDLQDPAPETV